MSGVAAGSGPVAIGALVLTAVPFGFMAAGVGAVIAVSGLPPTGAERQLRSGLDFSKRVRDYFAGAFFRVRFGVTPEFRRIA